MLYNHSTLWKLWWHSCPWWVYVNIRPHLYLCQSCKLPPCKPKTESLDDQDESVSFLFRKLQSDKLQSEYAFVKIRCQMSTIQIVNNPSKISWSQIQSWTKYKKLITSNLGQVSLVVKFSWKSVNNFLSNPPKNTKQTIRQTVPVV